jgi:UPF0716 protein FxsA
MKRILFKTCYLLIYKDFVVRNFGVIFLLVIFGFPALEIYTMIQVAAVIGWWLLAWLVFSALIGWVLIKEESMAVFGRLAVSMQNGQSPYSAIWDSGRTIFAGFLLILPGVLSDVIALVLLLLPNKSGRINPHRRHDDGIIEGEVRIVEAEELESKPGSREE